MSRRQSPDVGSMRGRVAVRQVAVWVLLVLVAAALFGYATWQLIWHAQYRIDIDVYRMGGQAWLDGRPLYAGDTKFHTPSGLDLPFTYPRWRPSRSARSPGWGCRPPAWRSR